MGLPLPSTSILKLPILLPSQLKPDRLLLRASSISLRGISVKTSSTLHWLYRHKARLPPQGHLRCIKPSRGITPSSDCMLSEYARPPDTSPAPDLLRLPSFEPPFFASFYTNGNFRGCTLAFPKLALHQIDETSSQGRSFCWTQFGISGTWYYRDLLENRI